MAPALKLAILALSFGVTLATPLLAPAESFDQYQVDDNRINGISKTDFYFLNLGLLLELLELEYFNRGLREFTDQDWQQIGYPAYFSYLLRFMRDQEIGHATELLRLLNGKGGKPCQYYFPYDSPQSYIDLAQQITISGEAAYLGFTWKLDSRTNILRSTQIFTTEARQNAQFKIGAKENPLNAWFDTPLTASQAYTLASRYIVSCPAENPKLPFKIFPPLNATIIDDNKFVKLSWQSPSPPYSWDPSSSRLCVAWVNQLNATFVEYDPRRMVARVPDNVFGGAFVIITDQCSNEGTGPFVKDEKVIAGPAPVTVRRLGPVSTTSTGGNLLDDDDELSR